MLKILQETQEIRLDENGQLAGIRGYGDLLILNIRERLYRKNPLPVYEMDYQTSLKYLLEFTDRESYLEWVKMWKWRYAELVRIQKILKGELRKPHTARTSWIMSQSSTLTSFLHAFCVLRVEGKKKAAQLRKEAKEALDNRVPAAE